MAKTKNDNLQGSLALVVLKSLEQGPMHGWASPCTSRGSPTKFCELRKARSTPRSTAWSRIDGSLQSGVLAKTIAVHAFIGSRHLAGSS
jgi:hypothetical protein